MAEIPEPPEAAAQEGAPWSAFAAIAGVVWTNRVGLVAPLLAD